MKIDVILTDYEIDTLQKGGYVSMVMPDGIRITATMTPGCKIVDISEEEDNNNDSK